MMMEPFGGGPLTDALIHAGFGLGAVAFLVRDILWLRCLSILANLAMGYAAYRAAPDPRWIVVIWAATFVTINLVHSIYDLLSLNHVDEFSISCMHELKYHWFFLCQIIL